MKKMPNWLILVGTNRNAGKTTLACNLIEKFSGEGVVAVKISPHFHPLREGEKVLKQGDDFVIVEETLENTGKDSSRMLRSGASKVYYIQAWDKQLNNAIDELLEITGPNAPVICESGWIRNLIHPGVFLILSRSGQEDKKESISMLEELEHHWVNFDGMRFDLNLERISLVNGAWEFK